MANKKVIWGIIALLGYVQQCEDFDCAEGQAFIAQSLGGLAEARGETFG